MPGFMPGIHALQFAIIKDVDGDGSRVYSTSTPFSFASRVYPTCGDKTGHDAMNGCRELGQPRPTALKALLIQEPLFSDGSTPPDFTSV